MKPQSNPDATPPSEAVTSSADSLVPASIDRDPRDLDRKVAVRACIAIAFLYVFTMIPDFPFFVVFGLLVSIYLWFSFSVFLKMRERRWMSRTEYATWVSDGFEAARIWLKEQKSQTKRQNERTNWSTVVLLSLLGLGFAALFVGVVFGLHERPESASVFRAVLLAIAGCLLVLLLWNSYRRKHRPDVEPHPGAGWDWRIVSFAEHLENNPADTFDEDHPKPPKLPKGDRFLHLINSKTIIPLPFSFMDFTGYSRRAMIFVKDRMFVLGSILIVLVSLVIWAFCDCKLTAIWTRRPVVWFMNCCFLVGGLGVFVSLFEYFGFSGRFQCFDVGLYSALPFLLHRYVILPKKRIVEGDGAAVTCLKAMIDGLVPVPRQAGRKTPKPVTQDQWNAVMGVHPFRPTGDETPVRNVSDLEVRRFVAVLDELCISRDAGLLFYARPAVFRFFRRTSRRWSDGIVLFAE